MYCTFWGFHWFWIMPVIFMILMFFCAALMLRRAGGWTWYAGNRGNWRRFGCWGAGQDSMGHWRSDSPSQILDKRYARGEITKEQYEQMRRDIEAGPGQSKAPDS